MNELWLFPLIIWLLIGIIAVIVVGMLNVKLFWHLIAMTLAARARVKDIEKRTAEKYNKFVAMSQPELEEYLVKTYSVLLELTCMTMVSDKDPDVVGKLYGNSLIQMLDYLGNSTVKALDYYYGEGYIERWCEVRYKFLENTGVIHSILDRTATANTAQHFMGDTVTSTTKK